LVNSAGSTATIIAGNGPDVGSRYYVAFQVLDTSPLPSGQVVVTFKWVNTAADNLSAIIINPTCYTFNNAPGTTPGWQSSLFVVSFPLTGPITGGAGAAFIVSLQNIANANPANSEVLVASALVQLNNVPPYPDFALGASSWNPLRRPGDITRLTDEDTSFIQDSNLFFAVPQPQW
jgi:hypothetical protein